MEKTINKKSLKERYKASKFYLFCKKYKAWIITVIVLIALTLLLTLPFIERPLTKGDYSYAFDAYKNVKGQDEDVALVLETNDTGVSNISDGETSQKGKIMTPGDDINYQVNVSKEGLYRFDMNLFTQEGGFKDNEFNVTIDGENVLSRGKLRSYFKNELDQFSLDSYGNEVSPSQVLIKKWVKQGLYDLNYTNPLPHAFSLGKGNHDIKLSLINGDKIALGQLILTSQRKLVSYEQYISQFKESPKGQRVDKEIQGEKFTFKNDTTPIASNIPDMNAYPYESNSKKLNIISNFDKSNQMLSYDFDVKETGLYTFNFNYQVKNSNHATFATIFVDDEIKFGELLHYPFTNTDQLEEDVLRDNDGNIFEFYLEKGTHSIKIKIDNSLYGEITDLLLASTKRLNDIYLSLKRIAGTVKDNNKEWDPDSDFPGIKEQIQDITNKLKTLKPIIHKINGTDANFQTIIFLETAINALDGILAKPKLIPNNYYKFSEGSGSIIESISNARSDLLTTPLQIDRIIVGNIDNYQLKDKKNSYARLGEAIKKFFVSFVTDYSNVQKEDKVIDVWVARSRQYVDLMQQTFDASDFKERTGYDVKFTLLADESKLILSNAAKISPDGVMGISNWLPYEMGIRDLTVDLSNFDDYGEVIKRFSPGALISLIADEKALALPETQDFYVTYYRKDICDKYEYEIPNTWDEVLDILPRLQRNGFNYYIPLSTSTASKSIMTTSPFIYQWGGNLFSDDGTKTTIDEENSLDAIKFMTELYTLYGLQSQVVNFFDAFRNGSLPIGVSTFDTYVKLALGAPEIEGMWDIKVSPGKADSEGNINRWQTGSAQSMCLIKKDDAKNKAGWELLKWWSSDEVQAEFGQKLTLLYGKGYIWNSANLHAFSDSIIFSESQKQTILNQWKYMREIPRVPGWYMLERELSNSWNNIVLKAENTRAVIENAVTEINKELQRKLIEFGYLNDKGESIKPYKATTLEYINELMNGGEA